MILRYITTIFITLFLPLLVTGQTETYTVKQAPFSSDKFDEFSPVYYKNGIVFCSNRIMGLTNYSTSQDKGLFKINYVDTLENTSWQSARLLSKSLTTNLNDGPATFNNSSDFVVYTRNLEISKSFRDISSPRNKLGLFSAALVDGKWTKIKELRFNSEWYNFTTPTLSPDGEKLYFASDKPGGYGGLDIYFSYWKGEYWSDPVNLGPVINTSGNEAYPFISSLDELFFSSDGHPGMGGKDIFFSRKNDTIWLTPVRLDPPINSKFDDFGLITDSLIATGYFSTNRNKSMDIFQFKTNIPQIFYTNIQKENQHCFRFSDSGGIKVDTLELKYLWNFGDNKKSSGAVVDHCFPGPGNYSVTLDIIDKSTGNLFFSKLAYNVEIRDYEQPYINSKDVSVKGDILEFDAFKSYYPGYKVLNYSWDFGDGRRFQGVSVKHSFDKSGEFQVNLGLTLKSESTGNIHKTGVTKKITILDNKQELETFQARLLSGRNTLMEIKEYGNAIITPLYSAESQFNLDIVFQVEILSSSTRIEPNSMFFNKLPKKYSVREIYGKDTGIYSYIVDQQLSIMATYIAYKDMISSGYKNVKTKIEILTDPAEKELYNLKKIFGIQTDTYFDKNNRLTSSAYILLDQITKLMVKYPGIRLEIGVHTDNGALPESKLALSLNYSHIVANYLINKGIDSRRLVTKGYGSIRPIASNTSAYDRVLNRRIDFVIVKE